MCVREVHGSGTMAFSIRTATDVCVASVHIESADLPDVDETDPKPRERYNAQEAAAVGKIPSWPPCS